MKLFDLHCDTLLCAYHRRTGLRDSGLQIDLNGTRSWENYGQVFAVFSEHELSPEAAWEQFEAVMDYEKNVRPGQNNFTPVFGVEGGKLLNGNLNRLDRLYERGVRVLTLVWADVCCLGGAFNTDIGLFPFGEEVVRRCFALGILPDVSHASLPMTEQVLSLASEEKQPILASHSCFRALNCHRRNLTDEHARRIADGGGKIGVNLVREHLTSGEICNIDTVIDHLLYGINLCGTEAIGLGCDFDGTDQLPDGISGISDLELLYSRLSARLHSQDLADRIFYDNVASFFAKTVLKR